MAYAELDLRDGRRPLRLRRSPAAGRGGPGRPGGRCSGTAGPRRWAPTSARPLGRRPSVTLAAGVAARALHRRAGGTPGRAAGRLHRRGWPSLLGEWADRPFDGAGRRRDRHDARHPAHRTTTSACCWWPIGGSRGQVVRPTTWSQSAARASLAGTSGSGASTSRAASAHRATSAWAAAIAGCARSSCSASACSRVVGQVAVEQREQPGVGRAGVPAHQQHRQGGDALAQVGAGGLARLGGLAEDVEQVVGELEGDAEPLAEPGQDVDGRLVGAGEQRAEPGRRRDQRAGLVGQHRQVVVDRVGARRADPRSPGSGR